MLVNKKLELISAQCLLCHDAMCDKACPKGFKPSEAIRAARFNDSIRGINYISKGVCNSCEGFCEDACIHYDKPIRIKDAIELMDDRKIDINDVLLETTFLGVKCENPFFLSSSCVASSYEMCAKALDMGFAGVVYKTIGYYIANEVSPRFDIINKESTPFIGFRNLEQISDHPLDYNLDIIKRLKKNYPSKVIIASIMGESEEEWRSLAHMCEEAGADIIECNFSCPQMAHAGLGSDVGTNEELVYKYTKATVMGTKLPVMAKMTPNITDIRIPARAAYKAGAKGIAAINTIKSITSIDLENLTANPSINGKTCVSGYSGKAVKPIALRHIAEIKSDKLVEGAEISGIGGIESWNDAMEFISLGCGMVQLTTSIMQYGYRIIDDLINGSKVYLKDRGYKKLDDIKGKALDSICSVLDLDRESIVYPKIDYDKCIGCGRCYISCYDGGHQAISFENRKPKINGGKCVGCHLCRLVCPTNAIGASKRINKIK